MKLFNAAQIKEWDKFTIAQQAISSLQLMETAATKCTEYLAEHYAPKAYKIFCAQGNNGGDGLAIARLLLARNFKVETYIIKQKDKGTDDFKSNLDALAKTNAAVHYIASASDFPLIEKEEMVIDALFGSGLNRALDGIYKDLILYLNDNADFIVAIDVPSGMFLDKSAKGNTIIKAIETLTFQRLKLCFLVAENAAYFGEIKVLDIGLDESYETTTEASFELTYKEDLPALKQRGKFSHKGTFGHALLVAGSNGKMGAAVLAAHACLRSGVGLLTCLVPNAGTAIMQVSEPHAMCINAYEDIEVEKVSVIGIGPGLSTNEAAKKLLEKAIAFGKPMVVDADALNIISEQIDLLNKLPEQSILTPHPKEFERLFGKCNNDFERMDKAIQASLKYPFVIVLKGAYTLVAYQGKGYFNTTGNPGMATGGSGDILTGILTGLLAQKYTAFDAARLGIYLHGLAAGLALKDESVESLLPLDTINHLGKAFKTL